jgi:putative component of toxin-antitoxin plasmid stabilization module
VANLNHQLVQLTAPRISSKQKKMEFKMKIKTLDSDEGIKIDSGRGTKIYLNRRPSGSYVVEIVGGKKSNMEHPSENIRFIQNIDEVIALVAETLGKSFSVIEY